MVSLFGTITITVCFYLPNFVRKELQGKNSKRRWATYLLPEDLDPVHTESLGLVKNERTQISQKGKSFMADCFLDGLSGIVYCVVWCGFVVTIVIHLNTFLFNKIIKQLLTLALVKMDMRSNVHICVFALALFVYLHSQRYGKDVVQISAYTLV